MIFCVKVVKRGCAVRIRSISGMEAVVGALPVGVEMLVRFATIGVVCCRAEGGAILMQRESVRVREGGGGESERKEK